MTSSVECPQFLGLADVGQSSLFVVNFTVGSSLEDSLAAHLSFRGGKFLVDVWRAS